MTSIILGGANAANAVCNSFNIEKGFVIDRALSAGEINTLEAWLAVEGDA